MKVLVITVGGSFEPVVSAVRLHKPDYVFFLCSNDRKSPAHTPGSYHTVDEEGSPCIDRKGCKHPSIIVQAKLKRSQYEKVLVDKMDNLEDCYNASNVTFKKIRERFPEAQICADYSGGTKTMSAGLVVAALDDESPNLFFMGGERSDLIGVTDGSQRVVRCDRRPFDWLRRQRVLETLFAKHDYNGCLSLLEGIDTVSGTDEDYIVQVYLSVAKAFLAWDRFDHSKAYGHLKPYARWFGSEQGFLARIIKTNAVLGGENAIKPGFSPVHDLLLNAERRMRQGNYDDAVGRIYRALELFAQLNLAFRNPSVLTGNVHVEQLHEGIREKYVALKGRQDKLQIPLTRAYELLCDLNHPVGLVAMERKPEMLQLLRIRNESILAHGFTPIEEQNAVEFLNFVKRLVKDGEQAMKINIGLDQALQFPSAIPDGVWSQKREKEE